MNTTGLQGRVDLPQPKVMEALVQHQNRFVCATFTASARHALMVCRIRSCPGDSCHFSGYISEILQRLLLDLLFCCCLKPLGLRQTASLA